MEDEGCGIPKKELPFIWDRFYRVDKDRSRIKAGADWGWPLSNGLSSFTAGVSPSGAMKGKSSVFSIFLPLAREEKE